MNRQPTRISISLTAVFLLGLAPAATAQFDLSASLGHSLDATDAVYVDGPQRYLGGSIVVADAFASERARVFYAFDTGDFSAPGDWRYYAHEAGGSYRVDLGAGRAHRLFAGGSASFRRNGAAWAAADYNALRAFTNLELHPAAYATVRTGYSFDLRRFAEQPGLDQDQHGAFGSVLLNLKSRTTLIGEVSIATKRYEGTAAIVSPVVAVEPDVAFASTSAGTGAPQNPAGMGNGGYGAIREGGIRATASSMVVVQGYPATRAQMVSVFGRLAQSLATRTGLSVEVSRRTTLGEVPPAVIDTPPGFIDDGVYDDPFASDAVSGRVGLRSIIGSGLQLDVAGTWQAKDYRATPARAADGTALGPDVFRSDRLWRGLASVAIPMFPDRTGPWDVDVVLTYDYTRHRSNDAFYQYTSHTLGIGATVKY